jgi:hypothetical protein
MIENILEVLISSLGTIISSLVGTFFGAWIIIKRQESKNIYPRELLIDILNMFEKYNEKPYSKAQDDFNTRSSVEKKAVLVALKNLGVPVRINIIEDRFDIENIAFDKITIKKEELEKMKKFVDHGLCDTLFFKEIDNNFHNVPPKLLRARNMAIQALESCKKSITDDKKPPFTNGYIAEQSGLSWNQFEVIGVCMSMIDYTTKDKIDAAIKDVKDGIFDHLFYWELNSFSNITAQKNVANLISEIIKPSLPNQ